MKTFLWTSLIQMSKLVRFFNPNSKGGAWDNTGLLIVFWVTVITGILYSLVLIGEYISANCETLNQLFYGIPCNDHLPMKSCLKGNCIHCVAIGCLLIFSVIVCNLGMFLFWFLPKAFMTFTLAILPINLYRQYQKFY